MKIFLFLFLFNFKETISLLISDEICFHNTVGTPLPVRYLFIRFPNENEDKKLLKSEDCSCDDFGSLPSTSEWFQKYCPSDDSTYFELLKKFENFPIIDFEQTLSKIEVNWGHPSQARSAALCRFKIGPKNKIFEHCYGKYTGFSMFTKDILNSLSTKMKLPEIEFIQNLGDWPLEFDEKNPAAIVSWCGSDKSLDIILPTYEMTDSTLKSMDQVMQDIQNVRSQVDVPFEKKLNKAVFRGRDSHQLRIEAAKLAIKRPDLIDGGITKYFFFHDQDNPRPIEQVGFSDFFKYKFVLNIDGTVAAYRFPFLLAGNSVIVKQESPYQEHFYGLLKPGIHYISFNNTNFVEILENLKSENDQKLLKIAKNGRDFAINHLQPLNIFCYHVKFLLEYSSRFRSPVNFKTTPMEEIRISKNENHCNCENYKNKSEL